jgi:hypothetical protein
MKEQFTVDNKAVQLDVLQVIDAKFGPVNEHIVAVNATDIVFSPEVTIGLRKHIASTHPDLKTIYYRTWTDEKNATHYSPVMKEDTFGINVIPEDLKQYERTLQELDPGPFNKAG